MEDRARFPEAAQADFLAALDGLAITTEQERYVRWLERIGDQPTLNAIADIIRTARAELPDLVGIAEIATMLNISRSRAVQLTHRDDFPAAIAEVQATPLRLRNQVEAWSRSWARTNGRPRKQADA